MGEWSFALKALPWLARLGSRVGFCLGTNKVVAPVPDFIIATEEARKLHEVLASTRALVLDVKGDAFTGEHPPWPLRDGRQNGSGE